MSTKMFVNLPVKDLPKSIEFFRSLGYEFNPHFTDETAACMVISEANYAMLLTHPKFQQFTHLPIGDAHKSTSVLIALSCNSREEVDEKVQQAVASGGSMFRPAQDHGFMYEHAFQDLDGHIWEVFWMDPAAIPAG